MKEEKSILFISYYFHPKNVTATRNYYLAKMLAEHGFTVYVIMQAVDEDTKTGLKHLPIHIYEIPAFDYRWILKKLGFKDGITSNKIKPGKFIEWAHEQLLNYPLNVWAGEGGGLYYRKAIKQADQLIKTYHIDFVYSSYRPLADHFISYRLKQNNKQLVWIGDFRDILWWSENDPRYQRKWIQRLLGTMDYITAVTDGIGAFWSRIAGKKTITIYSGMPELYNRALHPDPQQAAVFVINYTGKIFTQFQRADYFFQAVKEFLQEDNIPVQEILINYSGIHHEHWKQWITEAGLNSISTINSQQEIDRAWAYQCAAQINLLLTWSNSEIKGFIHGKFTEYLSAGKPILCIIQGDKDPELEKIYTNLSNSALFYNTSIDKEKIKSFLRKTYINWKNKKENLLSDKILESYSWKNKGKPLLDILNS